MKKSLTQFGACLGLTLMLLLTTGCGTDTIIRKGIVIQTSRDDKLTEGTKRQIVENNCRLDPSNPKCKGKLK